CPGRELCVDGPHHLLAGLTEGSEQVEGSPRAVLVLRGEQGEVISQALSHQRMRLGHPADVVKHIAGPEELPRRPPLLPDLPPPVFVQEMGDTKQAYVTDGIPVSVGQSGQESEHRRPPRGGTFMQDPAQERYSRAGSLIHAALVADGGPQRLEGL